MFTAVQTVHRALNALLGANCSLPCPEEPAVEIGEGTELLEVPLRRAEKSGSLRQTDAWGKRITPLSPG